MSKPIDKLEFWKERIDTAQQEHFSVYVTTLPSWLKIAEIHKGIIDRIVGDCKVLDAGCGYGRASEWFGDGYVGVDFSPDFIAIAKNKYPNKKFDIANLDKLPYKDKEFDWGVLVSVKAMIISNQGEQVWSKMEKEVQRVCKKVLVLEYTEPERYWII